MQQVRHISESTSTHYASLHNLDSRVYSHDPARTLRPHLLRNPKKCVRVCL